MQTASLVNGGLLKSSIRRFWPLWLIDIFAWALFYIAPLAAVLSATVATGMEQAQVAETQRELWGGFLYMALPITFAGAIIVALYLNERLFSPRAATFYGALPARRSTLFATSLLAGLVPQVLVEAVVALPLLAMCVSMDGLSAVLVAQWLAFAVGVTFVMNAIAYTVCHLTGSRSVAVFLYLLVNILSVCIAVAVQLVADGLLYGMTMRGDELFDWAAPILGIAHYCLDAPATATGVIHIHWLPLLVYCLVSVALLVVAACLNAHRDMERAGDAVAFDGLRPVLKYLAGICGALLMGAFVYLCAWLSEQGFTVLFDTVGALLLAVAMAAGAFLGVLFAQMVMSKSTHALGSSWKGGAVLAAASILLVGACYLDVLGFEGAVPEVAEVDSVELLAEWSAAGTFTTDGGIEQVRSLHRQVLEYGDTLKNGDDSLTRRYDEASNVSTIGMVYHLKNGQLLERTYQVAYPMDDEGIPGDSLGAQVAEAALAAANSQEAKNSRLAWLLDKDSDAYPEKFYVTIWYDQFDEDDSHSVGLSMKQAADFAEKALTPDVLEGTVGDLNYFWGTTGSYLYDASVDVTDERGEPLFSYQLSTSGSPNTVAWVKENLPDVKLNSWDEDDGVLLGGVQTMAD